MKISNISTGNKLKRNKTFDELKEGDIFYWVVPTDKSIEDITYNITNIKKANCQTVFGYSELNPDIAKDVKRDILIDWTKANDSFKCDNIALPSNSSFFVSGICNMLWATSLDLVYELIKKYNIYTHFK